MKTLLLLTLSLGLFSCTTALAVPPPPKKMKAFTSERELQRYFRRIAAKQKRAAARKSGMGSGMGLGPGSATINSTVSTISAAVSAESVTNTQHAGVDEGGIVKTHGDHFVILRRGRLFTVAVADESLRPTSTIDAFGPDIDPKHSWFDEMLVSANTIVVIGYSYQRDGTEIGLFNIDAQGQLTYRSTYHLRSNDYYSSSNYASRLIGNKLIFYAPLRFYAAYDDDPSPPFPAVRKWHTGATAKEFRRVVKATEIYRPQFEFDVEDGVTLHTVTSCDLANGGFDCQARSVIGPESREFYVSPDAVYVWATLWSNDGKRSPSLLFRLPLDGSGPGALRVSGSPVDQFSFLQSAEQHLNVMVRSEAKGEGMAADESAAGDVALMRVPLRSFSDGSQMVPATSYQQLPRPDSYYFQNRFVGDFLIYGTGTGWGVPAKEQKDLYLVEWARGNVHQLSLLHGVDRIEQMGAGAVVIGTDGKDLHFTSVRLNRHPQIVSHYLRQAASQGEQRSHGFFYKPEGEESGTLGLPISLPGRPERRHLFESSAAILFLRNEGFQFRVLGELRAEPDKAVDDRCRASCVDWYGNARPLFLRGRMFALLGYELVEGKVEHDRMVELRRISYAPITREP